MSQVVKYKLRNLITLFFDAVFPLIEFRELLRLIRTPEFCINKT